MSDPQTKPEIIDRLRAIQRSVAETVAGIPASRFEQGTPQAWSPADYLKHLLLAVKPFARATTFPPDALRRRFGAPNRSSAIYADVVSSYQARLDDGIRAEDYESVVPSTYRLPDSVTDLQAYLLQTWNEANDRLIDGLAAWSETDLDTTQLLHPALNLITVREMLFFTIYHNSLHGRDIQAAGA